jgi:hypothetical protein
MLGVQITRTLSDDAGGRSRIKPREYPLIGVLHGQGCFCGEPTDLATVNASSRQRPMAECEQVPCVGDVNETSCGGLDLLAVFNYSVTAGVSPWQPL